jgi:hypothetical protein
MIICRQLNSMTPAEKRRCACPVVDYAEGGIKWLQASPISRVRESGDAALEAAQPPIADAGRGVREVGCRAVPLLEVACALGVGAAPAACVAEVVALTIRRACTLVFASVLRADNPHVLNRCSQPAFRGGFQKCDHDDGLEFPPGVPNVPLLLESIGMLEQTGSLSEHKVQ